MAPHKKEPKERQRDKAKAKQAGLLWWSQAIFQLAHEACQEQKAYGNDGAGNIAYWRTVVPILETAATALNKLGKNKPLTPSLHLLDQASWSASNCSSDDECPDDYICVEGTCESLFPMD